MALNFPASPIEGQTYAAEGATYIYHNGRWVVLSNADMSAYLPLTGGTLTGTIDLSSISPLLRFTETDQVKPAGQYRHYLSGDVYYFQRALTADHVTNTTVWSYTGSTGVFNIPGDITYVTKLNCGSQTFPGDPTNSGMQLTGDSFNMKPRNGLAASGPCIVLSYNGVATFQILRSGAVQNATGTITVISDAATKTDVTDATPKLDDINKLRVVNYTSTLQPDAGKLLGFVAQEVQEVFPALVEAAAIEDDEGNVTGEGPLGVKWSVLVPALVKAVQELTARLEALENPT
jgi:hypothetical protein